MGKHKKGKKRRLLEVFFHSDTDSSSDEWEATAQQLALALKSALETGTVAAPSQGEPSQPSRFFFEHMCCHF